jgi:predicted nucleic acid-binding protein
VPRFGVCKKLRRGPDRTVCRSAWARFFYIECANILWKYTRRFNRSLDDSLADLTDLGGLALRVTSTAYLMEDALSLAAETGLTAYDACYAALARRLDLPLVTVDKPLCQAVTWAIWLGDLEPQGE